MDRSLHFRKTTRLYATSSCRAQARAGTRPVRSGVMNHAPTTGFPRYAVLLGIFLLQVLLAACGNGGDGTIVVPTKDSIPRLAVKQILTFPNVGIIDSAPLDPALVTDPNTSLIVSMVYSGLVKFDINLNVVPDQATWDISPGNTIYTFHLKPNIAFSDGAPVTAQTYVYTLTRALLPEIQSTTA